MRYMMMVKANSDYEAGNPPSQELMAEIGKLGAEAMKAGKLISTGGLAPSSASTRITLRKGKRSVVDGPFGETKELIAGFWVISVKSRDEAIEWAKRIPFEDGETIELRRVFEAADFAEVVSQEAIAKEQAWRDATQQPITN